MRKPAAEWKPSVLSWLAWKAAARFPSAPGDVWRAENLCLKLPCFLPMACNAWGRRFRARRKTPSPSAEDLRLKCSSRERPRYLRARAVEHAHERGEATRRKVRRDHSRGGTVTGVKRTPGKAWRESPGPPCREFFRAC